MIKKPNYGYGGFDVSIVYDLIPEKDCVISEYIDHTQYYTSHHLVKNGEILYKCFFTTHNDIENFIKKGAINDYDILYSLNIDDIIFENIFKQLNYSGFICCDFTICDGFIKFFEINPRIGGSLINNIHVFKEFIDIILKHF
jgi:predicted ATP-grasp superfamily ATP-dependent carboligase